MVPFEVADDVLRRSASRSSPKAPAERLPRRGGMKRAKVSLARKIVVILRHVWADCAHFQFAVPAVIGAVSIGGLYEAFSRRHLIVS